jgi:hypothetical protein
MDGDILYDGIIVRQVPEMHPAATVFATAGNAGIAINIAAAVWTIGGRPVLRIATADPARSDRLSVQPRVGIEMAARQGGKDHLGC